jgi:hypothetical protein
MKKKEDNRKTRYTQKNSSAAAGYKVLKPTNMAAS